MGLEAKQIGCRAALREIGWQPALPPGAMRRNHHLPAKTCLTLPVGNPDDGTIASNGDLHRAPRLKNVGSGIARRVQEDAIQNVPSKRPPESISRGARHARYDARARREQANPLDFRPCL
ncbi:MAG: hypothetical protein E5V51_16170, partial [Mesorhizobium sp.]